MNRGGHNTKVRQLEAEFVLGIPQDQEHGFLAHVTFKTRFLLFVREVTCYTTFALKWSKCIKNYTLFLKIRLLIK
jgi:hypothetical protein